MGTISGTKREVAKSGQLGCPWWQARELIGVPGRGQGALRVVEHNGAGATGVVDDAARAWGFPSALPGHLGHIHAPLPEVSHQEAWGGARAEGRARRQQIRAYKWPGPPRDGEGCWGTWASERRRVLF